MRSGYSGSLGALLGLLLAGAAPAGPWPGWRGPTGQGQTDEKGLPLTWGGAKSQNVVWKVPLVESAARR